MCGGLVRRGRREQEWRKALCGPAAHPAPQSIDPLFEAQAPGSADQASFPTLRDSSSWLTVAPRVAPSVKTLAHRPRPGPSHFRLDLIATLRPTC